MIEEKLGFGREHLAQCRPPPWAANAASSLPDMTPFRALIKQLGSARPMAIRQAAASALTRVTALDQMPLELLSLCQTLAGKLLPEDWNQVVQAGQ